MNNNTNLKYLEHTDPIKFVELYYLGEIELKGFKCSFTQYAEEKITEGITSKKEIKEKLKGFNQLLKIYNEYIQKENEALLFTSFNDIYLQTFFKETIKEESIFGNNIINKNKHTEKEDLDIVVKQLSITYNVLDKYLRYKTNQVTDYNYILNRYDIDAFADIILNGFYFIEHLSKRNKDPRIEFLIRKIILLTLNNDIINGTNIVLDNNSISIQLRNDLFLYDKIFYIEIIESLDKLLNLNDGANKSLISKIYTKFLNKLNQIKQEKIELEEDGEIIFDSKDEEDHIITKLKEYSKKYNIKLPEENSIKKLKVKGEGKINNENEVKENKEKLENTLLENYKNKNKIKTNLKNKILGQNKIIDSIIDNYINRLFLGINKRPISLLFAGDSGLGKTELAKQLSNELGTKVLHIPMGNYKHSHMDTSLLGAPPSYVGFDEKTVLEKYIIECKKNGEIPVILFDEIEKGHSGLQTMYLELFDEGKITFLNGNTYDLSKSIIIMTSNLGIEKMNKTSIGFNINDDEGQKELTKKQIVEDAIKAFFRPEILNRVSEIFVFNKLTEKNISDIINNSITNVLETIYNSEMVRKIFGNKIQKIPLNIIRKELKDKVKLNNIENIRKIESEAEQVILKIIEKK